MAQSIIYICSDCKKLINKSLADGETAEGSGGECPRCNAQDGPPTYFQILRHKHIS